MKTSWRTSVSSAVNFIIIITLVFGASLALGGLTSQGTSQAWASQDAHNSASSGQGKEHGEAQGEGNGGHGEHPAAPFSYYIHWLVILIILGAVLKFQISQRKQKGADAYGAAHDEGGHGDAHGDAHGHHGPAPVFIPMLVICLVALMFLMENFSAVAHFHEPIGIGLIKFVTKMTAGALVMLYGLSFRH